MARSKQNKTNNQGTDGKRKETKEERRARLESTAEAREVRSLVYENRLFFVSRNKYSLETWRRGSFWIDLQGLSIHP
jgi:hypothetical protein